MKDIITNYYDCDGNRIIIKSMWKPKTIIKPNKN